MVKDDTELAATARLGELAATCRAGELAEKARSHERVGRLAFGRPDGWQIPATGEGMRPALESRAIG